MTSNSCFANQRQISRQICIVTSWRDRLYIFRMYKINFPLICINLWLIQICECFIRILVQLYFMCKMTIKCIFNMKIMEKYLSDVVALWRHKERYVRHRSTVYRIGHVWRHNGDLTTFWATGWLLDVNIL